METGEDYQKGSHINTQESNLTISVTESAVKLSTDTIPEEEGDPKPLKACKKV